MKNNFSTLSKMIYSGRGFTVGMTPNGYPFIGYSLTGRSPSSQARMLVHGTNTGVIRTAVTNPEQLKKGSPALLIYPAIVPVVSERFSALICSNGAQTKLIYSALMSYEKVINAEYKHDESDYAEHSEAVIKNVFQEPFYEYDEHSDRWIDITTYEPDAPNNTPRISTLLIYDKTQQKNHACIHIIWCNEDGQKIQRYYKFDLLPSWGQLITTYKGINDEPLSPFEGDLLDVVIESDDVKVICKSVHNAIKGDINGTNPQVSAAVTMLKDGKFVHAILNRFKP